MQSSAYPDQKPAVPRASTTWSVRIACRMTGCADWAATEAHNGLPAHGPSRSKLASPMPNLTLLLPGIVGAFVGVIGWLFVGMYIQRRQFMRQAKNGARAVYFEIEMNLVRVQVARQYGSYAPLSSTSFERLLPELATWLQPDQLQTVVTAYMGHAGYDQASSNSEFPPELRQQAMTGILDSQERALDLLRAKAFSTRQARQLEQRSNGTSNEPAITKEERRAKVPSSR